MQVDTKSSSDEHIPGVSKVSISADLDGAKYTYNIDTSTGIVIVAYGMVECVNYFKNSVKSLVSTCKLIWLCAVISPESESCQDIASTLHTLK